MPPTLQTLFTSPDQYLHSFDGADAIFVPMDRAAFHRSIFLDDRIAPASEAAMRVPLDALTRAADDPPAGNGWIFHIAHCGSTLLARALDELSDRLVLREPLALRQAALTRDAATLRLVLRMLGKRYAGSGAPVVKANVPVNFVIPDIAASMPGAPAIFLYYGLEDYLPAILRSDNHRAWLRRVTDELARVLGDLSALSDAERAAALWMAQLRLFQSGLSAMPQARALDAERFFSKPAEVLRAAAKLFSIDCSPARIAAVADGPLFRTYAKNPAVAFDNLDRIERREAACKMLEAELAAAQAWLHLNAPDHSTVVGALAARHLA